MSFTFSENFSVALPLEVYENHSKFQESVKNATSNVGIIVEIAAIHAGYTENNTYYSAEALSQAIQSWVTPYPKPVIMNHDVTTEAVGRVVGAKMDKEENGKDFIRIQAAITDKDAIEKVLDKRYMTGSIGGKAEKALCTICETDWAAKESGPGMPCKHTRGKVYDGTVAALKLEGLSFKEYSFVNVPADSHSYVRSVKPVDGSTEAEDDDEWVKPSRFFIFSLSDHQATEYADGTASKTFSIGEMESTYLNDIIDLDIKNDKFLYVNNENVSNTNESVRSLLLQESSMSDNNTETEQDDVLAVTEQLAEDLSETANASEDEDVKEEDTDEVAEDTVEDSTETSEDDSTEDTKAEESDDDKGESDEDDKSDEDEVKSEDEEKAEDTDDDTVASDEDKSDEDESDKAEESENGLDTEDSVEPEVASLKEEVETLKEENKALRKALHRTLAERVVDTKISLGIEELANRSASIEEHSDRSASSLADSLRDLAKMPAAKVPTIAVENLSVDQTSAPVAEAGEKVVSDGEDEVKEETAPNPAKLFVEQFATVLSGKTNLH